MNSMPASVKILVIYLVCIPLALFLGYQISNPYSREAFTTIGIVLLVLVTPLLLRWHRPFLFFSLGTSMVAFFLPGRPRVGLVMVAVSLLISILQRTLQHRFRFVRAPEITWPLMAVIAVVLTTMFLRGGLGFSAFGSKNVGGSRYLMLLLGVVMVQSAGMSVRRTLMKRSMPASDMLADAATAALTAFSIAKFLRPESTYFFSAW